MNKFIGLDIKKNAIRFASVSKAGEQIVVDQFNETVLDGNFYKPTITNENFLQKELMTLFKDNRIKQCPTVYSDFGFNLLIKTTKIVEALNMDKVREAIFMELGSSIQVPFNDITFDILSAKPTEKREKSDESDAKMKKRKAKEIDKREQEVNVVITNETDLIYVGDAIETTKNIPYGVDMSALSYHRLFSHFSMQKVKRNMYLLLELNCGEAIVTVMSKGVPIFTQYAEYNPDHWRVNIENQDQSNWSNQWTYDEVYEKNKLLSLIDNINRIINTFSNVSSSSGIKYTLLVGDNPLVEEGIASFLSEHIDVPVITPELAIVNQKGQQLPKRYYKAVGLSMKKEEFK